MSDTKTDNAIDNALSTRVSAISDVDSAVATVEKTKANLDATEAAVGKTLRAARVGLDLSASTLAKVAFPTADSEQWAIRYYTYLEDGIRYDHEAALRVREYLAGLGSLTVIAPATMATASA